MAYFPFLMDITDLPCLVVGGGRIALHKVKTLLSFSPKILVIAKEFDPELENLDSAHVTLKKVDFTGKEEQQILQTLQEHQLHLCDFEFLILATSDRELNHSIARLAKEAGIKVNAVDQKEDCSFYFPAMIKEENMLVTISSGGESPALVADLKKQIKKEIPEFYGKLSAQMGYYREQVLFSVEKERDRKYIFEEMLSYGKEHEGKIPESFVRDLIRRFS